jgi:hypothetical protein
MAASIRLVACFLICALGCGRGPKLYDVSGTVLFDGKPVEEGEVIFVSADKDSTPAAGKIVNGEFRVKVSGGKKKVKIAASRKIPGKGAMGEDYVYQSYIPIRYNDQTILEEEVGPNSENRFRFDLRSSATRADSPP